MKATKLLALAAAGLMLTTVVAESADARAGRSRAGIHRSMGDRGNRTHDNNAQFRGMDRTRTQQQAPAAAGAQQKGSWLQRNPFMAGLMGAVMGSALFMGLAHLMGGFGGFGGILMLLALAFVGMMLFKALRRRREPSFANGAPNPFQQQHQPLHPNQPMAYQGTAAPVADLNSYRQSKDQGLAAIALNNPGFTTQKAVDDLSGLFFQIQETWSANDLVTLKNLTTDEMYEYFSEDLVDMEAHGMRNVIKNPVVRTFEITEAWTEGMSEYITARIHARLIDYTEKNGVIVEGSATEPTEFHEVWTFARQRGEERWKLSAINQV